MLQPKVLISESGEYLFYSYSNNKTFFTLMDRSGNIVKIDELPLTLESFLKAMKKAGYNDYQSLL